MKKFHIWAEQKNLITKTNKYHFADSNFIV